MLHVRPFAGKASYSSPLLKLQYGICHAGSPPEHASRANKCQLMLIYAGARKGGTTQKLNWLDMARQKSEQAKQRRKPEVTPSQSTGILPLQVIIL